MIVAFYTEDTAYEHEAVKLKESLVKLGLKHYIKGVPSQGAWELNCGLKPQFIKDCLNQFQETIMYTDVDSRVLRYPTLLDTFDKDMAVHYLNGKELLSGTLIFRNSDATRALLDAWIAEQKANPKEWDQRTLQRVIIKIPGLKIMELPLEYIQIFDHRVQCKDPVIMHHQASRRLKQNPGAAIAAKLPFTGYRLLPDCSIVLLRTNREAEQYMDKHYCRLPGERRWWLVTQDITIIDEIKNRHVGEISIIGKGPSLDRFKKEHITGPTIALNEAFAITQSMGVEYGTQLDDGMQAACYPYTGTLFCSPRAKMHYAGCDKAKLLDPRQLSLSYKPLSVEYAICIAQVMGATSIRLCCFDAMVSGDCGYAKAVGHGPEGAGPPTRFLGHKKVLEKFKIPITFFIP